MNASARIGLLVGVFLLTGLAVSCKRGLRDPKAPVKEQLLAEFVDRSPRPGEAAPDFEAVDVAGKRRTLSEFLTDGPLVLDFANYT